MAGVTVMGVNVAFDADPASRTSARPDRLTYIDRNGGKMSDPVEALVVDLLEWIGPRTRAYSEVMEAWRTSCPRLPVWEEANARGFVRSVHDVGQAPQVALTELGVLHVRQATNRHAGDSSPNPGSD
jgi:D-3-phosphoglycerate dehydrogenase